MFLLRPNLLRLHPIDLPYLQSSTPRIQLGRSSQNIVLTPGFTLPHSSRWHVFRGRKMLPGQLIHVSVCLMGGHYKPKASRHGINWGDIVGMGVGREKEADWMPEELEPHFEMDLYDVAGAESIMKEWIAEPKNEEWATRLNFLASVSTSVCHQWPHRIVSRRTQAAEFP